MNYNSRIYFNSNHTTSPLTLRTKLICAQNKTYLSRHVRHKKGIMNEEKKRKVQRLRDEVTDFIVVLQVKVNFSYMWRPSSGI